jgi:hypothetical protein
MPRKRPTSVLVLAILNFVVAAFGLCGLGLELSSEALLRFVEKSKQMSPELKEQVEQQKDLANALETGVPGWNTAEAGRLIVRGLLTLLLVVSGIGLILLRRWGWALALGYAILSIGLRLALLAYLFLVISPALPNAFEQMARKHHQDAEAVAGGVVLEYALRNVISLVYPVIVLIFMLLPGVVAAFRDSGPGYPRDEAEDDALERGQGWGDVPPAGGSTP